MLKLCNSSRLLQGTLGIPAGPGVSFHSPGPRPCGRPHLYFTDKESQEQRRNKSTVSKMSRFSRHPKAGGITTSKGSQFLVHRLVDPGQIPGNSVGSGLLQAQAARNIFGSWPIPGAQTPRHSEGPWTPGVNPVGTDFVSARWMDRETLHALGQEVDG